MKKMTMDGNTAASYVSYAFTEIAVIYPITPSSPMAEHVDAWQAEGKNNLFGQVPRVIQMQSESGVAGALHGCLTCGSLATTYTCSQGLLLMQPSMFKIAGELLPTVFHVSARSLATHALSIFGDHQDVMACRQTGFAMLASASVQECMDMALIAHLATLKTSVPFLHFFDGFRTSHELTKIDAIEYDEMGSLLEEADVEKFRKRALTPDNPICRGTTQNGDVYFQNRERANPYYSALPAAVQNVMDKVEKITKRAYHIFDYYGNPEAEYVVVVMGSAADTAQNTVETLNEYGEKTGVVKVRLYRPFDGAYFCKILPKSCKRIAVLDRTKEAGSLGEPLYLDVCAALQENGRWDVKVVGGRYGLSSKEFTPADCFSVFQNLKNTTPKNHFTVGITDDVAHTSLSIDNSFQPKENFVSCKFYGLGSDGTVGANKNSIKIINNHTDFYAQGYFAYDSKKSGGATISHLRFDIQPIHAPYLVHSADFIACHNPSYVKRYDLLQDIKMGGIFLLNFPYTDLSTLSLQLPSSLKHIIATKQLQFYVIDATKIANEVGLGGRTSGIMQAAFFKLHPNLLPYEKSVQYLKEELSRALIKKGNDVVQKNFDAIDRTSAGIHFIQYPSTWQASTTDKVDAKPQPYFQEFIRPILSLNGDRLPTSAFQADGSVPTGTTKYEENGVAFLLPKWLPENCIQCNQCSFVCPHACIRPFLLDAEQMPPDDFHTIAAHGIPGMRYRIQVTTKHCMGCSLCANVCPAKEKALVMRPKTELQGEEEHWDYAQTLPTVETPFKRHTVKGSQFYPPLFEFPCACAGCGETTYIKVLTQLFGEKMLIANATGCSSIYGGSCPTCPYTVNHDSKGPAWANSLFEDNAEFGLGMRLAWNFRQENSTQKSIWIIGGDGWAYDIGYGGLDHVLASGENVNVLVLDSEVYSNTGGQVSKATPLGAAARFATKGKRTRKKELGQMAMAYGNVYVAQVCMGADKQQLLNAFMEAEAYDGPSLIIAYSPCIAHGMNMSKTLDEERLAVECGYWLLYRFHPALKLENKNPFRLDSKTPTGNLRNFLMGENRFASLKSLYPEEAERLFSQAEEDCKRRLEFFKRLEKLYEP